MDWVPGVAVMGITAFIPSGRGAHAEQVVVDARSVAGVPHGVSMAEAATLPMNGLTARLALDRLGLARGQTLAVTGAAGAVGGYVVRSAAREGISVIAISAPADEALVRGFGAHDFVARGGRAGTEARQATGGGADAVVDAALIGQEVLRAVRDGGRMVCLRPLVGDPDRGISAELISVRAYGTQSEKLRSLARLVEQGVLSLRVAETSPPSARQRRTSDSRPVAAAAGSYSSSRHRRSKGAQTTWNMPIVKSGLGRALRGRRQPPRRGSVRSHLDPRCRLGDPG